MKNLATHKKEESARLIELGNIQGDFILESDKPFAITSDVSAKYDPQSESLLLEIASPNAEVKICEHRVFTAAHLSRDEVLRIGDRSYVLLPSQQTYISNIRHIESENKIQENSKKFNHLRNTETLNRRQLMTALILAFVLLLLYLSIPAIEEAFAQNQSYEKQESVQVERLLPWRAKKSLEKNDEQFELQNDVEVNNEMEKPS